MKSIYNPLFFAVVITLMMNSCLEKNPNLNESGKDELKSLEIETTLDKQDIHFKDIVYVPIYSEIYVDTNNPEHLLAATLSIRNTSLKDSLFISKIDYHNSEGLLVKNFLDRTIGIKPLETVNYVIEKEDISGGSGANFTVELSAKTNKMKPLIQAIMVGHLNNWSFSFSSDGYSIK